MPGTTGTTQDQITIRLPDEEEAAGSQDQEWCEVDLGDEVRRIRFHDYEEIYEIPGLYERLFYEELRCDSPRTVCSMLAEVTAELGRSPSDLRVLDVGAGNGMVGEQLKLNGAGTVVGVDIIEAALEATERDRPEVYEDYRVIDMIDIPEDEHQLLREHEFNALTCVAALGFDDIPTEVFANAFDLVSPGGLIGISIKEEFVSDEDPSGFAGMIRDGLDRGALLLRDERRYRHRLSAKGEELYYMALIAEKGEAELRVR